MQVIDETKNNIKKEDTSLNLPVFAIIYDKTNLKLAKLADKNTNLNTKNQNAQTKIDKAQNLIDLFEQIKDPTITQAIPTPVFKLLETIAEREKDRISSLRSKIEKRNNKIASNNKKIDKHTQRLETCKKVDTFLQKLKSSTEKKEVFIEGFQEFNSIALKKTASKLAEVEDKITNVTTAYDKTHSKSERLKLSKRKEKLLETKGALEHKLTDLGAITEKIIAIQNASKNKVDEVIEKSCDGIINAATENPDEFVKNQAETVIEVCSEVIGEELLQSKEQQNSLEQEIVLPEPSPVEYREAVTEAEIRKLKESKIEFASVKDPKHPNCCIIKYDKADSNKVQQTLDKPLENTVKR